LSFAEKTAPPPLLPATGLASPLVNPTLLIAGLILSLGLAVVVFLTGNARTFVSSDESGFAVVECPATISDEAVVKKLREAGITGAIHEGGQSVLLDDFSGLILVPLEQYDKRVLDIDPRNDGYAAKLKAFFTDGTTRRFFVPLGPLFARLDSDAIKESFIRILAPLPISGVFVREAEQSFPVLLVLFVIFALWTISLAPSRYAALLLMPPLAPLVMAGPAAFTLVVELLAGYRALFQTLRSFCRAVLGHEKFTPSRNDSAAVGVSILFTALYAWTCRFNGVSLKFALSALLSFMVMALVATFFESGSGLKRAHIHFVSIRGKARILYTARFTLVLLPFTIGAIIAVFASWLCARELPSEGFSRVPPISLADYKTHAAFESSFSFRSLYKYDKNKPFEHFIKNKQGLLSSALPAAARNRDNEIPPFPLTGLLAFLGNQTIVEPPDAVLADFISALLAVAVYLSFVIAVIALRARQRYLDPLGRRLVL
jgi:hypothetical protein